MPNLERFVFGRTRETHPPEDSLGVFQACYTARTMHADIDACAVAGGVATSLLAYSLETGLADCAVVAGFEEQRPWVAEAKVVTSREGLIAAAGSKYQPHAHLLGLRQAVDAGYRRIAMTGKPCVIHAVRKMEMSGRFRDITDRLVLLVGLICTSHWTRHGTEFLIQEHLGVPLSEVSKLTYRARPFPGLFEVVLKNGDRRTAAFVTDTKFLRHLFAAEQPDACRNCLDGPAQLADLSVADCWGHPTLMDETAKSGRALSAVLVRTDRCHDVFRETVAAGYIAADPVAKEDCFVQKNGAVVRKVTSNALHMRHRLRQGLPVRRYA